LSEEEIGEEVVPIKKQDIDSLLRDNELLIERCSRLMKENSELEAKLDELERSLTVMRLGGMSQPHDSRTRVASILCLLGGFMMFTQGMAFLVNYSSLITPILEYLEYSPLYGYLSSSNYMTGVAVLGIGGLLLIASIFMSVTSPRIIGGFILFSSLISLLVGGGYGLGALLGIVGSGVAITAEE